MHQSHHDEILRSIHELPPLSRTVQRLTELFRSSDFRMDDIIDAVRLDSTLGGRLLQVANASAFGYAPTDSLQTAIVRLGSGTVMALASASCMRPVQGVDLTPFGLDEDSYWRHTVAVTSFATALTNIGRGTFGDQLLTAALLHDIGKLVLADHLDPEQARLLDAVRDEPSPVKREFQVLGVHHAEVSAVVAQHWDLSESLVKAVQHHHDPPPDADALTHGLVIANHLAWRFEDRDLAEDDPEQALLERSLQAVGMDVHAGETVFATGCELFEQTFSAYE